MNITTSGQFDSLLDRLADDVSVAIDHYNLYRDLQAQLTTFEREFDQASAFWWLTFRAHFDSALTALSRVFDQRDDTISFSKLLRTMRDSPGIFKSSITEYGRLESTTLKDDLVLTSTSDAAVKLLVQHRGNRHAHRGVRITMQGLQGLQGLAGAGITYGDVEQLVDRAHHIRNRIGQWFKGHTCSAEMIGREDFQYILECVRGRLTADDAEHKRDLDRLRPPKSDTS